MADSRNQYGIYIAAYYILANISLYRGLNDQYKENMSKIEQIARTDNGKARSFLLSLQTYVTHVCSVI